MCEVLNLAHEGQNLISEVRKLANEGKGLGGEVWEGDGEGFPVADEGWDLARRGKTLAAALGNLVHEVPVLAREVAGLAGGFLGLMGRIRHIGRMGPMLPSLGPSFFAAPSRKGKVPCEFVVYGITMVCRPFFPAAGCLAASVFSLQQTAVYRSTGVFLALPTMKCSIRLLPMAW